MSVLFDNTKLTGYGPAQTVEKAYRVYGGWSHIRSFKFNDLYSNASVVIAGSSWDHTDLAVELPASFFIEYEVDGKGHGVKLRYVDSNNYLLAGLTEDDNFVVVSRVGGVDTTLLSRPKNFGATGKVEVAYRQQRFSTEEVDAWESVTFWVNGALVGTFTQYTGEIAGDTYSVALAAQASTRTFTDVRVPQLTDFSEWASLDPGEPPAGGLQRVTEGRYIKSFIRYDGALRAWRSAAQSAVAVLQDDAFVAEAQYDQRELYSHVQMLGGYVWAEAIDVDLIRQVGHRFAQVNNPYIITEAECYEEAVNTIRRQKENSVNETAESDAMVTLEPEDRIQSVHGDRIVTGRAIKLDPSGYLAQTLTLRKYAYG